MKTVSIFLVGNLFSVLRCNEQAVLAHWVSDWPTQFMYDLWGPPCGATFAEYLSEIVIITHYTIVVIVFFYQILINEWIDGWVDALLNGWLVIYGKKCRRHEKKVSRRLYIVKLLQTNRARQRQWHSSNLNYCAMSYGNPRNEDHS